MVTSIRDLVDTLETEARLRAGTVRHADDSVGALGHLGRALHGLVQDGLEDAEGPRQAVVRQLADSCAQQATAGADFPGRLSSLAGCLSDLVGLARSRIGREERWAIAVELASAARVLASYAADRDTRRDAELAWAHHNARLVVITALRDPPGSSGDAVLDSAVPNSVLAPELLSHRVALEALAVISDRLRRSAAGLGRHPTLLEVLAVTRASESTARYGATTLAAVEDDLTRVRGSAAYVWRQVRTELEPYASAPRPALYRDLGIYALRTHCELRRAFGPVTQVTLPIGPARADAIRTLRWMVNELPPIARDLATALQRMADEGDLHALAHRLPFQEHRLDQFLLHRPVVADRFDVAPIVDRLRHAATAAEDLADEFGFATRRPSAPNRNEAATRASRYDPYRAERSVRLEI